MSPNRGYERHRRGDVGDGLAATRRAEFRSNRWGLGYRRVAGASCGALAFVIAIGVIVGSAASAAERGPVKSLLELRHQDVVVQKFDLSCGAAALATILDFQFGEHVTERQVAQGLISRKEYIEHPGLVRLRRGFSLLDMKRYVDRHGFRGVGYGDLAFSDLLRLAPIIVAVNPIGYNHFVVFRGAVGSQVLLADPAFGNRTMSRAKFMRVWIDFPKIGRVGFIVTRNEKPAPPGRLGVRRQLLVAPTSAQIRQAAGL